MYTMSMRYCSTQYTWFAKKNCPILFHLSFCSGRLPFTLENCHIANDGVVESCKVEHGLS